MILINTFILDKTDKRLKDIKAISFDSLYFDHLSIDVLTNIIKNDEIIVDDLMKYESDNSTKKKVIALAKIKLIEDIIKNDPYSKAFLIFQDVRWKVSKTRMPLILIPVTILNFCKTLKKNGQIFVNPVVNEYVNRFIEETATTNNLYDIDTYSLNKIIEESNGRIIYNLYLTYFKIKYKDGVQYTKHIQSRELPTIEKDLFFYNDKLAQVGFALRKKENIILSVENRHHKLQLLFNIVLKALANHNSILVILQKGYAGAIDYFIKSGINPNLISNNQLEHIEFTNEAPLEDFSEEFESFAKYNEHFEEVKKGYKLREIYLDLIKYKHKQILDIEVENFENLEKTDIHKIKEALAKLDKILKKLKITKPVDSIYNKIDYKEIYNSENFFIYRNNNLIEKLNRMLELVGELNKKYNLKLSLDCLVLEKTFDKEEIFDCQRYPKSWEDKINFQDVKKNLKNFTELVERTNSFYLMVVNTYIPDVFELNFEEMVKNIYSGFFEKSDVDAINYILNNKIETAEILNELTEVVEKIHTLSNRLEESAKQDNSNKETKNIITAKIINNKFFSWINFDDDRRTLISNCKKLTECENLLNKIIKIKNEIGGFIEIDIVEETELKDIVQCISLFKTHKINNLDHIFTEKFKKSPKDIQKKKLKLLSNYKYFEQDIKNLLKEILIDEIDLKEIAELKNYFNLIRNYKTNIENQEIINVVADLNKLYIDRKEILQQKMFSKLKFENYSTFKKDLQKYKLNTSKIFMVHDTIKSSLKNNNKTISINQIISLKNMVANYYNNLNKLLKNNEKYEKLFGETYEEERSDCEKIKNLIADYQRLTRLYNGDEIVEIDALKIQELKVNLEESLSLVNGLNRYYYCDLGGDINSILKIINQFNDIEAITSWGEILKICQLLRMYGQIKLIREIMNGKILNNCEDIFLNSLFKRIIKGCDHLNYNKFLTFSKMVENKSHFIKENFALKDKKRVCFSGIFEAVERKEKYSLVILDEIERISMQYFNKLQKIGNNFIFIENKNGTNINGSINDNLSNNKKINLDNNIVSIHDDEFGRGFLINQKIKIYNKIDILKNIIADLEAGKKVNLICSSNELRVQLYERLVQRLIRVIGCDLKIENLLKNFRALIHNHYLEKADKNYLIISEKEIGSFEKELEVIAHSCENLIILDEFNLLKDSKFKEKSQADKFSLLKDVNEETLKILVDKLDIKYQIKQGISPYDLMIGEGNNIKLLIKIMNLESSGNLEDLVLMNDDNYRNIKKLVFSIEEMYYNLDDIVNKVKEVIDCD